MPSDNGDGNYEKKASDIFEAQDAFGNTPLHYAVQCGNFREIQWLLMYMNHDYINRNIQNADGNTPLHIAASNGNDALIKELNLYGADNTIKNNAGFTALDIAIQNGHSHLTEHLQ